MSFLGLIYFLSFFQNTALANNLEAQAQLNIFAATMPAQKSDGVTKNNGGLEADIQTRYEFNKYLSFKFEPWAQQDVLTKTTEEQSEFQAKELVLQWKKSSELLKVGYSTVNWEGTDILNPIDFVNAKNLRDPLSIQNLSAPGVFYSYQIQKISWDLVYIPLQSKAWLPGQNSPWWPRSVNLPVQDNNLVFQLPSQVQYQVLSDQIVNNALSNNVAARTQYHGQNLDLSLAGCQCSASPPLLVPYIDVLPVQVSPKQIYQLQNPVHIQPIYYSQRVLGLGATLTQDSWIFRFAGQHAQPIGDDSRLPSWSEYGVLGVEKNLEFETERITLLLQATASHQPASADISLLSTLLQKAVMAGWRWSFGENLVWNQAVFRELQYNSTYSHSDFAYRWSDHLSFNLAGDFLSGPPESILGEYSDNTRYELKTILSF